MMRERGKWTVLAAGALGVLCFVLPPVAAEAAFPACACRCIDATVTEKTYVAPEADCRAACVENPGGHDPARLRSATRMTVSTGDRCVCEWSVQTTRTAWTALTAGRTSCAGDCAAACGGAAFVDPAQSQTANRITVNCLRDDQCATGVFAVYAQRNNCSSDDPNCGAPRCEILTYTPSDGAFYANSADTDHFKEARCIIPATALNADIECQMYGGAAKGGVCRRFDEGENLTQYIITRPWVDSRGEYAVWDISTNNRTVDQLNAALNADASHAPSLCELYGETQDVIIGSQSVNTNPNAEQVIGISFGSAEPPTGAQPLSVSPSKRYVCAVKKMNTCGTVKPGPGDGLLSIQTASAYRCLDPVRVGIPTGQVSTVCFSEQRSTTELCVNSPGTRCCAEAAAGCYSDADCLQPKRCIKENEEDQFGSCEYVTICDEAHEDWRCRSAALTERSNPSICSPEVVPGTSRCGTGAQACCGTPVTTVNSGCALDLLNQSRVGQSTEYYGVEDLVPFMCLKMNTVRAASTQWRQNGNDVELIPFREGGACLTNTDPSFADGRSVTRCPGADELCCNTYALGAQALLDAQVERLNHTNGASCLPAETGFSCMAPPNIPESQLNAHGFQNAASFLSSLAASPYCKITPISSGSYVNTQQCAPNFICCETDFVIANYSWCETDADCGNNAFCDLVLRKCLPSLLEHSEERETCVDFARAAGEADVNAVVSPEDEEMFSCQPIADADANQVRSLCLIRGCETENATGNLPEGMSYRCCAPGTGIAPSAVSGGTAASGGAAAVKPAPSSIQWLACLSTGTCTLDEIVANGAAFANFLIAISGAVYFAIFVYAGFLYLTAGASSRVEQAKTMLRHATTGLVLLMGAFVIIRFIQQSFIGNVLGAAKSSAVCGETEETKDYACRYLNVDPADSKALKAAISQNGCKQGFCPEDKAANYVCCPLR